MDTLESWLRPLGLEQYAPLFESHGIDLYSLPLISDNDLAELGVLLGHRRLLLNTLSRLDNHGRAASHYPTGSGTRRPRVISTVSAANAYAPVFMATYNAQFATPANAVALIPWTNLNVNPFSGRFGFHSG
ncbi:hypothetical protein P3T43_001580 [Paraburkholderia sp. GAS41]|jgi:hypothetical protein|uniref:SAM domain-containing protein n=1 Tax=Paraburkholderia sp. GAS41 TaxID=3035134 RepID=UPI003D209433